MRVVCLHPLIPTIHRYQFRYHLMCLNIALVPTSVRPQTKKSYFSAQRQILIGQGNGDIFFIGMFMDYIWKFKQVIHHLIFGH